MSLLLRQGLTKLPRGDEGSFVRLRFNPELCVHQTRLSVPDTWKPAWHGSTRGGCD